MEGIPGEVTPLPQVIIYGNCFSDNVSSTVEKSFYGRWGYLNVARCKVHNQDRNPTIWFELLPP